MTTRNENDIFSEMPLPLESVFKDLKKAVRIRYRRFIALVVVVALAFGLLGFVCGRASASAGDTITFNSDTFNSTGWRALYTVVHSFLVEHAEEGWDYMILGKVDGQYTNNPYTYSITVSQYPIKNMGGQMEVYLSDIGSPLGVRGFYYDTMASTVKNLSYTSVGSTQYGYRYYPTNYPNIGSYSYGQFWSSHANDICPANLIVPEFLPPPDNRVFTLEKYTLNGVDYIKFDCYPLEDTFTFLSITFKYFDLMGNIYTETIYDDEFDSLTPVGYVEAEADGLTGLLNPNTLSYNYFNIFEAEITTLSSEYGSKTITGLSLVFNPSLFPVINNYNDYTSFNEYPAFTPLDSMAIGTSSFYVGTSNQGAGFFYWSNDHFIELQPFELKTICLPDLLHTISPAQVSQLYESYDLIVTGCNEDIITGFYGDSSFYGQLAGSESSIVPQCMSHSVYVLQLVDGNTGTPVYSDSECGLFFTRNGLLKQISYFCGDTSKRLLEFETRLVDDDGILATIQEKMNLSYKQDSDFYNAVLPAIKNISYSLNGLDFGVFQHISDTVDSILDALRFNLNDGLENSPFKPIWDFFFKTFTLMGEYKDDFLDYSGAMLDDDVPLIPTVSPTPTIIAFPTLYPTRGLLE